MPDLRPWYPHLRFHQHPPVPRVAMARRFAEVPRLAIRLTRASQSGSGEEGITAAASAESSTASAENSVTPRPPPPSPRKASTPPPPRPSLKFPTKMPATPQAVQSAPTTMVGTSSHLCPHCHKTEFTRALSIRGTPMEMRCIFCNKGWRHGDDLMKLHCRAKSAKRKKSGCAIRDEYLVYEPHKLEPGYLCIPCREWWPVEKLGLKR